MKRSSGFPFLRVFGGALLILAGILGYLGVGFGASAILILVAGGVVVLIAAFMGHRARPADIGIFIVGVLVLGVVSAGYSVAPQTVSYSATRAQLHSTALSLLV